MPNKENIISTLERIGISIPKFFGLEVSDDGEQKFYENNNDANSNIDSVASFSQFCEKLISRHDCEYGNNDIKDIVDEITNISYYSDLVKGSISEMDVEYQNLLNLKNEWEGIATYLLSKISQPEDYHELDSDLEEKLNNILKLNEL